MRELRPALQALINTGHCNWHTTMDIVLPGDDELFFSSGEIFIDHLGKTQQYVAKLKAEAVGALSLSQDIEVDMISFLVANVDMVMGRLFTGAERKFDGAEAVVGTIFIDRSNPDFEAGEHFWDPKMPGELVSSEIKDADVGLTLVSTIDSVIVAGRTIASEFQWREPFSNVPDRDPNDLPGGLIDWLPGGCFVTGTLVKAPGGPKPIESFEFGSPIRVWDFSLGKLVDSVVTEVEIHYDMLTKELRTLNGLSARVTGDQPLYTGKGTTFNQVLSLSSSFGRLGVLDESEAMRMDRVVGWDKPIKTTTHHLHVAHPDHNYVLENGLMPHNNKRPLMHSFGRYGDLDSPTGGFTTPWNPL